MNSLWLKHRDYENLGQFSKEIQRGPNLLKKKKKDSEIEKVQLTPERLNWNSPACRVFPSYPERLTEKEFLKHFLLTSKHQNESQCCISIYSNCNQQRSNPPLPQNLNLYRSFSCTALVRMKNQRQYICITDS